jgi:hypothetical protein
MTDHARNTPGQVTERPAGQKLRKDGTYGCGLCGDTGFIDLIDHQGVSLGLRPCDRCLPAAHARWASGAYKPTGIH